MPLVSFVVQKRCVIPGSVYVRRNLKNADDLNAWAKGAGITNVVPAHEMHVTQVYSRKPVVIDQKTDSITAEGGKRSIGFLGDKGGVVLHFDSPELKARHAEAMEAGASHDFPQFLTHVTLSYQHEGADPSTITPPSLPLQFGPEIHEEINDDWSDDKGLRKDSPTPSDVHVAGAGGNTKRRKAKLFSEVRKYASPGLPHPHHGNRTGRKLINPGGNLKPGRPAGGSGRNIERKLFGAGAGARFKRFGKLQENKMDAVAKFVKAESVLPQLGLVLGWAIVCKEDGKDYWDVQKNHIPEGAMLEASADFMEHSRSGNEMHAGPDCGTYLFAFPLTEEIAKAMGLSSRRTGLMVGYKPPAAVLAKFVSGEYTGFSIEGYHLELGDVP